MSSDIDRAEHVPDELMVIDLAVPVGIVSSHHLCRQLWSQVYTADLSQDLAELFVIQASGSVSVKVKVQQGQGQQVNALVVNVLAFLPVEHLERPKQPACPA